MKLRLWTLGFFFAVEAALAVPAHTFTFQIMDRTGGRQVVRDTSVLMTPDRLRLDLRPLIGKPMEVLYSRVGSQLLLVDHPGRVYIRLDMKALSTAAGTVETVDSFVRDRLGELSGQKRMADVGARIERTRDVRRISGVACQRILLRKAGDPVQELWAASYGDLGMAAADFAAMRQLVADVEAAAPALDAMLGTTIARLPLEGLLRVNGYPTVIRQLQQGRSIAEVRMSPPARAEASASDFALPSSYRAARAGEWRAMIRERGE